jgi:hypothetical protein
LKEKGGVGLNLHHIELDGQVTSILAQNLMLGYGIRFEMGSGNALSNAYALLWTRPEATVFRADAQGRLKSHRIIKT